MPAYETAHSAGMDLIAALDEGADIEIAPGARALVPTGFAIALPEGYEAQVRPRSGLAHKHGVTVLNTPGTIDADYRGEVKVILVNFGARTVHASRAACASPRWWSRPVTRVAWRAADSLDRNRPRRRRLRLDRRGGRDRGKVERRGMLKLSQENALRARGRARHRLQLAHRAGADQGDHPAPGHPAALSGAGAPAARPCQASSTACAGRAAATGWRASAGG